MFLDLHVAKVAMVISIPIAGKGQDHTERQG